MKNISKLSLVVVLFYTSISAFGQDEDAEEVFELSPFAVDARGNYGFRHGRGKTTQVPPIEYYDLGSGIDGITDQLNRILPEAEPKMPVFLVKRADEIRIQFAISFYDDLETVRRSRLLEYVEKAREVVAASDELRFLPGPILVAEGDRKRMRSRKRSEYTSHAHYSVSFDNVDSESSVDRILQVKRLMDDLELDSDMARLYYGSVKLVLENPDQYRGELLEAIFEDLDRLSGRLEGKFDLLPTRLGGRVHAKRHGPADVAVWIDYDYKTESIRDRELEDAMALFNHKVTVFNTLSE